MIINAYAKNLGWLFEDLKGHFVRHGAVASESPLPEADAWICIRTSEFGDSPDPTRTIVQVHDLYEYEVTRFIQASLVVFTHPAQRLLWDSRGFIGRHLTLPIGVRSGIEIPAIPPAIPTLGFFCGETPKLEKRSHLFHEVVKRARDSMDFEVLLIGRNLDHLAHLGNLEDRAAGVEDYSRVDAIFTASISPAIPLSVYEACAVGLPIVSTPRWFPIGNWPSVFIRESTDDLSAQVVTVLADRQRLFEQRREHSTSPFLLDDWVAAQINHHRVLVPRPPRAPERRVGMERIHFHQLLARPCLRFGWSTPEPWGVWSDGPSARLFFDIKVSAPDGMLLKFSAGAFTHARQPTQRFRFKVNQSEAVELCIDGPAPQEFEILISGRDLGIDPPGVWIDVDCPDASSPHEAGMNEDRRQLGLAMHWIEIVPIESSCTMPPTSVACDSTEQGSPLRQ